MVVIVGIIGAYGVWAVVCKSRNGFWVYPIIGKLVVLERVVALTAWVGVVWGAWCFIEWGKLRLQVGEVKRKKV